MDPFKENEWNAFMITHYYNYLLLNVEMTSSLWAGDAPAVVGCDFTPITTQLSQCVDLGLNNLDQNPVIGGDDDNAL